MTPQAGGHRRSPAMLFAGVVALAIAVSAVAYVFLVTSENAKAAKFKTLAANLHDEVDRATGYLKLHAQNSQQTHQNVEEIANELSLRIPFGPVDLDVGGYIDNAAQQAGILDVKWSMEGGIKMPKSKLLDKRTPAQRLLVNPTTLVRTVLTVEFHARYREFLVLVKKLAEAPWPIEMTKIALKREGGPSLSIKMEMRYSYE